jgi:hypothetical protein
MGEGDDVDFFALRLEGLFEAAEHRRLPHAAFAHDEAAAV